MKTIILIISITFLVSCMNFEREAVTQKVKNDYNWPQLNNDERLLVSAMHGKVKVHGTGHLSLKADGSVDVDTTAKFESIMKAASKAGEIISNGTGKAAGMF